MRTTTYPDGGQRMETLFRDGSTKSVTGTAAQAVYYGYGVDQDGTFTVTTNGSPGSVEWSKASTDFLGRGYKTVWPGNAVQMSYYNRKNQMTNSVDPDGVSTIYLYNGLGQAEYTVVDANRDGGRELDRHGSDHPQRVGCRSIGCRLCLAPSHCPPFACVEVECDSGWRSNFGSL